jgi:hypothetical protein
MSATVTVPTAPAPAGLAAPAGDWKTLSEAMTAQVPPIAGRPVPVACAPGAGLGSPACYLPGIPVIEVDGDLLEAGPGDCDPAIPADRERYPVTWGCSPSLRMSMRATLWLRMSGVREAPPGWVPGGAGWTRCRRGGQSVVAVSSAMAVRADDSSTIVLPAEQAASRAVTASRLIARGRPRA